MLQLVLVLVGVLVGSFYPLGIEPDFFRPLLTGIAVPASCVAYALIGALLARSFGRRFENGDGAPVFSSFLRCMFLYRVLLLLLYALQVYFFHWPAFVADTMKLDGVVLAERLAGLLPFFLALILSWFPLYRIDRVLRGSQWSRGAYVTFQAQLVLGPILALLTVLFLLDDLIRVVPWLARLMEQSASLGQLFVLAVLLGLFVLSPIALRLVWRGTSLPKGPLRDRLEALCARAGFGVRDLLVWDTRGGRFANALVTGVVGRLRYVFFTKPLLDGLEPEEVEAVLGHEMGHARHHHLVWFFAFGVGLVLITTGLDGALGLQAHPIAQGALTAGSMIAFWGFLILHVFRRFERQADLHSLRLLGAGAPLAAALCKVCALNGAPVTAPSVTHGSVASRIEFLARSEAEPAFGERFERGLRPLRAFIGAVFVAGVVVATASGVREAIAPKGDSALEQAQALVDEGNAHFAAGRWEEADRAFRQAIKKLPKHHVPWLLLGLTEEKQGRWTEARESFVRALNLVSRNPLLQTGLREKIEEMGCKINSSKGIGTNH